MTILNLVPDTGDDLPARQISRRIRGIMAEHRVTGVQLAEAIGMNQKAFSRRYADQVDWSVNEIALVARVFGRTFAELVAVDEDLVRHVGLEPTTRWLVASVPDNEPPVRPSLVTCPACGASWDEPLESHPHNGCERSI